MADHIETVRTQLEKLMLQLPSHASEENRRFYLAGVIDTMADLGKISDEERDTLYAEYAR